MRAGPNGRSLAASLAVVLATITSMLFFGAPAQAAPAATPTAAAGHHAPTPPRADLHTVTVLAEQHIAMPQHGGVRPAAVGPMTWHGGPVAHSVVHKVFLDLWGPQWSSYPSQENYLYYYYNSLGQPSDYWSQVTSQYCDTAACPSFGAAVFGGWVQDNTPPPAAATPGQLAAEAVAAANYFGPQAYGTDAQVVVLSPSGTHPNNFPYSGFCAWHSYTYGSYGFLAFTNMPFVQDAGSSCGANTVIGPYDGFSIVGGHEYAETITDPALNAWYYVNTAGEIGDQCAWRLFAQGMAYGTFAQQLLWSNANGGCVA